MNRFDTFLSVKYNKSLYENISGLNLNVLRKSILTS